MWLASSTSLKISSNILSHQWHLQQPKIQVSSGRHAKFSNKFASKLKNSGLLHFLCPRSHLTAPVSTWRPYFYRGHLPLLLKMHVNCCIRKLFGGTCTFGASCIFFSFKPPTMFDRYHMAERTEQSLSKK